ncbi:MULTISPECIES: DUF3667 domain-containing protein [unclassified Duganella]|uniref:DUF3667 domain-containing protein n=1 Tax=unclassified Duganella TaxID=2636909 RepID=UPI001314DCB6|nr:MULTISPECIES: DUF3667 domain-containing protein [unclassified Duganella]
MSPSLHTVPAPSAHHAAPEFCPGCKARLGVNFCPQCGQESVLHPPSMGEFVAEFIGHYVAIEGKLWRTLGQLLLRPGGLTKAYMAGQRVNYMQPLRLFLTLSVILFALLQFSGFHVGDDHAKPTAPGGMAFTADVKHNGSDAVPPPLVAGATRYTVSLGYYGISLLREGGSFEFGFKLNIPDSQEPSMLGSIGHAVFPHFDDKMKHFSDLPPATKAELMTHGFFARMPYVIFFMVPVFALFLKLLYLPSRRPYGEYLLFALHVNAFGFFVMALMHVTPWGWGLAALGLVLALYIGRAMQNVYGGSPFATAVRWLVLTVAYLLVLMMLIVQLMAVLAFTTS